MTTLATLGPRGSDSEHAGRLLVEQLEIDATVVLVDSYASALRHAWQHDGLALIPAAYQHKDAQGHTLETWADTHFRIETGGQLELWLARVLPLKELALAARRNIEQPRTVGLHAATQYYAQAFLPEAQPLYYASKPEAVRACAAGDADACIGSLDVVQKHPGLVVLRTFAARMCWTVYRRATRAHPQPMDGR